MSNQTVIKNVAAFFDGDIGLFEVCTEQREDAWLVIQAILRHDLTDDQMSVLAAGPLETLLSWHGAAPIERVEEEARRNPKFNDLLGGVWRGAMPDEIWERVERARKAAW